MEGRSKTSKVWVINMPQWKNTNLLSKTKYSVNGLKSAFISEKAVRNESVMLVIMTAVSLFFCADRVTSVKVFLLCLLPLIVELINTSAEIIIDLLLGPTYREDVRIAKDMLSAAVFLTLAFAYSMSLILIVTNR